MLMANSKEDKLSDTVFFDSTKAKSTKAESSKTALEKETKKDNEIEKGEKPALIPEFMDPTKKSYRRFTTIVFGISIILLLIALMVTFFVTSRSKAKLVAGKDFYAIIEENGYKLSLDAISRPLALIHKGGVHPKGFLQRETVEIPVNKIAVGTGQFDAGVMISLGMENTIIGVSVHPREWQSSEILEGLKTGKIKYLGLEESIDYEALISLKPELTFASSLDSIIVLEELNLPSAKTYTGEDNSLNARFAFIDWLASLANMDDKALAWRKSYDNTHKLLQKKIKDQPTTKTVWAVIFEKRVFVEPGNNWVGELLTSLGGDYLFLDLPGDSTIEVSLERFIDSGKETEVLFLYPGFASNANTKEDIIRYNDNLSLLKPLGPEGRTYMTEPIFYESFGRLEEISIELAAILHPELFPDHKLVFFREIT
jgi:iron complex transport system substrate-binding protein